MKKVLQNGCKSDKLKKLISLFLIIFLVLSLNPLISIAQTQFGTPFSGVPDASDAVIYQVNMRSFSPTRDFKGVISHLDSIKNLGANVIYLMPVYEIGILNAVNSPYCVKDFKNVNPEFGSLTDLQQLVDEAHSRGLAVMFDWVGNHTSWDNAWITDHKDWYKQDGSGNIESPILGWKDVAQLDFTNADMRLAMIDAMKYWVYTANCDGFRCDYADGPPADFWKQAIDTLRNINTHKLLLLAEGGRKDHFTSGFDYIFGFSFYDKLKSIHGSNSSVTGIGDVIDAEYSGVDDSKRVVHYTSNHDVNSTETPLDWFGGKTGSVATFVAAAYMKGIPFIYNGQEVGYPKPINFMSTNSLIDWSLNQEMVAEYKRIIAFYNSSNALRKGTQTSNNTADVCAYMRVYENDTVYVVSNFRNVTKSFTFPAEIATKRKFDAFTNKATDLGVNISLSAYEYRVFADSGAVIPVAEITLSSEIETVATGSIKQLVANITPENATYKSILWTSTDTITATVTSNGLVTGISPGTAYIIAKNADQSLSDTCKVTVTGIDVTGVTINKQTETISADGTSQLSATVAPDDASYKSVIWESKNPDVATVNSDGLVEGISPGNTLIIVTTLDNSKKDTCALTVTGTAVSEIVFNQEKDTVNAGSTLQLVYTILPVDATNKTVYWTSSNNEIATVNASGIVTGIALGSAFIYAETADGGKKDTCEILVVPGNEFTVYFSKPSSWANSIKIYYWDAIPSGILPSVNWPGVDMTYANGWHQYTFSSISFTNLIFNDRTNQTGNLSRDKDGWYKDDVWYDENPDPVAIADENSIDFNLYPNPISLGNNLNIQLPQSYQNSAPIVQIVDSYGKIVIRQQIEWNNCVIDASTFKLKGCYIVQIISNNNSVSKLIIVK